MWKSPSHRGVLVSSRDKFQFKQDLAIYKHRDERLPLPWYLLELGRLKRGTLSKYCHRQSSNSASVRMLKDLKAFLHWAAVTHV